ncbi:hypothetical protein [Nocardioides caldifontis]|uniref:hypothetical protein n=1 Tax=Nocardioides caldifontis TaxID=2588938 RepID=UPI0011DF26E3|nr:hypothetical protein [Nocardioides caldifontis]
MELRDFYKIRAGLKMNAPAAPAAAVEAMERTLADALGSSAFFHTVEVDSTDDPDRRLIAMVGFGPYHSENAVAAELERLWGERVHYTHWEAHALLVEKDQVELQGGTLVSENGYHVTVHVVAQRLEAPVAVEALAPAPAAIPEQPKRSRRARAGVLRRMFAPVALA